ncbi:MAG: hypothetical protein HXY34_08040 [Candidatus Thorarchaeota archaeon]|nr:hypothetical protein [Candidatus Thorarchaeota archaeon]
MGKGKVLVVDGNNIAYSASQSGIPQVQTLRAAIRSLRNNDYRPLVLVSAALIHNVDEPDELQAMISAGDIIQVSRGQNDDLAIIRMSQEKYADIVTNDRFLDWLDRYPWLSSRVRRYRLTPSGIILV